jgi:hypothetical protein
MAAEREAAAATSDIHDQMDDLKSQVELMRTTTTMLAVDFD